MRKLIICGLLLSIVFGVPLLTMANTDTNEYGTASVDGCDPFTVFAMIDPNLQNPSVEFWPIHVANQGNWDALFGKNGYNEISVDSGPWVPISTYGMSYTLDAGVSFSLTSPSDYGDTDLGKPGDQIVVTIFHSAFVAKFTLTIDECSNGGSGSHVSSGFAKILQAKAKLAMQTYTVRCIPPDFDYEGVALTQITYTATGEPVADLPRRSVLQLWKVDGDSFSVLTTPWDFLPLETAAVDGVVEPGYYLTTIDPGALLDDPVGGPGTYIIAVVIDGYPIPVLTTDGEPATFTVP